MNKHSHKYRLNKLRVLHNRLADKVDFLFRGKPGLEKEWLEEDSKKGNLNRRFKEEVKDEVSMYELQEHLRRMENILELCAEDRIDE